MNRFRDRVTDTIQFRAYEQGDIYEIDLHPIYEGDTDCQERCEQLALDDKVKAFTILNSAGKPIAVIGMILLYTKVAEVWAIVDKSVEKQPHFYATRVKFLADMLWFDLCPWLKRAQIYIKATAPWSERWAKYLGFTFEAAMVNYGEENETYLLFSKVR